jgi:hypothetical protein
VTTPGAAERKRRKSAERAKRRAGEAQRRQEAQRRAAEEAEQKAEAIAPRVQREPVLSPDGTMLRGPRLEPDGLTFKVSNPVRHLEQRGRRRAEAGDMPAVREAHVVAAERLLAAWHEGADGVGIGASNYGERTGGTVQSGTISDAVLATVGRQVKARQEVGAAQTFLGALWPAVHAVVIRGIDVTSWATAARLDRKIALGYLSAALDRLVEFYAPKLRAGQIRATTQISHAPALTNA